MGIKVSKKVKDKKARMGLDLKLAQQESGISLREAEKRTGIKRHQMSSVFKGDVNYTIDTYLVLRDLFYNG